MHVDVEVKLRLIQEVVKVFQADEKVLWLRVQQEVVAEARLARGPVLVEICGSGSPKRIGDASPPEVTADLKWRLWVSPVSGSS